MKKLKHLDLFSGIGGFAYAANQAGFDTIGFVEKDGFCTKILKKHWPKVINHGDIKSFNFNQHVDLITGGFPCQPFSVAGKMKGKDDERHLWPEFFRIIKQSKPTWIVAENVTGIVALELDNILADLETENYQTATFIIPACAANAPHRRDRVWIVAYSNSKRCTSGCYTLKERQILFHEKWNVKALQEKWFDMQPNTWKINKAQDWFEFSARACRTDDGLSNRMDRVRALGNAIVPQVAYVILSTIFNIETVLQ